MTRSGCAANVVFVTDSTSLPPLRADLLLMHAPAVFEFRDRRDIYFPFLGTSGDVPITPLYEYFPVGFKSLQGYLGQRDHEVKLLNLSSLFLRYPKLALETVVDALDVRLLGIDLHWMVHVQGCLEVARRVKAMRPDLPIILGGTSSTYYAQELIQYPFIDMVMQGYDTHVPMDALLRALAEGTSLEEVPNLLHKDRSGQPIDNGLTHLPESFACGIDWSQSPPPPAGRGSRVREVLSTQNAGCAYNCGWCGGSRQAFRRIFGKRKAMARKPVEEVQRELRSLSVLDGGGKHHFYSVGTYNETRQGLQSFLDAVGSANLRSISYEQFHLTPEPVLRRMVEANPGTTITLSPESHDPHVAKLAGRGVYTNEEMEAWLARALDIGVRRVDIWYFVGMPEQTERSVLETVDYCRRLLERFPKGRVVPMVCPMIPFLDPGSNFFEAPKEHGYRVFHRTAEEHRRGMERASILHRINYETEHLSRRDLVRVGFRATAAIMNARAEAGHLPKSSVRTYVGHIDDALAFIDAVHEADCVAEPGARSRALEALGDGIAERNAMVLFGGVTNQAFPIRRPVGGRWFDELGWSPDVLDAALAPVPVAVTAP